MADENDKIDAPAKAPRPSYGFLVLVSLASLAADLGSKWWAIKHLDTDAFPPTRITLIANHVELVFARNKGGAWGIFQGASESVRLPFFFAISLAAVIFIFSVYRKVTPDQRALKWGLPLVLGGALGNLVNRIEFGHVVDFIDVFYKTSHWPTFNIADVSICVGVGLMALDMFTVKKSVEPAPAKDVAADDGDDEGEDEPPASRTSTEGA